MAQVKQTCSKETSAMDNLKLSDLPVPEIPKDIIFPNELNQYLRDQIQYLTHENGMLKKNVSENELQIKRSESKIENLNAQIKEYHNTTNKNSFLNANNLASTKIVELSKKLREKNSEVEVLKTKCSKLEQCIVQMEGNEMKEPVAEKPEKPLSEIEEQMKSLQDKLNSTTSKLFEAKNLNVQLKNDLKLANKLLQQEVGDNFETLQSLTSTNNWRGRAQIICDLQQKNNELREKLRNYQDRGVCDNRLTSNQTKNEQQLEALRKENAEVKQNLETTKKKMDSARVRCKYYESECCSLKAKLNAVYEQNERDHELITTLTAQATNSRDAQNDVLKQKQQVINRMEQENRSMKIELEKEKCKSVNLQKEIEEKIADLESLKKRYKNCSLQNLPSPKPQLDEKALSRLEAEKQRLLELMEVCNRRLESERDAHANIKNQFRMERQRAAKLEAKLARAQLQTDRSYSTYSSLSKMTDNTLEDQLELAVENIKALQTRLQIEQQERQSDFQEFSKLLQNYTKDEN